jgi:hypothetical protein
MSGSWTQNGWNRFGWRPLRLGEGVFWLRASTTEERLTTQPTNQKAKGRVVRKTSSIAGLNHSCKRNAQGSRMSSNLVCAWANGFVALDWRPRHIQTTVMPLAGRWTRHADCPSRKELWLCLREDYRPLPASRTQSEPLETIRLQYESSRSCLKLLAITLAPYMLTQVADSLQSGS